MSISKSDCTAGRVVSKLVSADSAESNSRFQLVSQNRSVPAMFERCPDVPLSRRCVLDLVQKDGMVPLVNFATSCCNTAGFFPAAW